MNEINIRMNKAAKNNDVTLMKRLKTEGADVTAAEGFRGETPMHTAAQYNSLDAMEWLKSQGADINAQHHHEIGFTPMHIAVICSALKAVKWLKSQGADISIQDNLEETPMDIARRACLIEVIKCLEDDELSIDP